MAQDSPIDHQQKAIQAYKKKQKKKKKPGGGSNGPAKLETRGTAGTLAEAIERQANAQKVQAQKKSGIVQQTNPLDAMMQDFMSQYNSIGVAPTPIEQLREMAEQQVGAQFDPMMDMLKQQMGQKQATGKRSMGEARDMYGALSKDFLAEIPQLTQQFAAEDRETNQRYDSAQQQLSSMYGGQAKEQDAVLKQLGIAAAAPEASQLARDDQKYFQGQMETDQQSALNALNQQQMAAQNYQQNLGDTTKIAGENTAQDIGQQLRDYMDQANTQMGGLQAQRGSALAQLLQQMQGQAADNAAKEEQQQFDNLLAMSRFQLDTQKAMQDSAGGSSDELFKGTSGLSGAQNFLSQQYSDSPIKAQNLMQQLNDVLANKDVVKGKFQMSPGDPALGKAPTYSDVGQEYMMDLLRAEIDKENQAQPGRYGNNDINNAINALLAYMGKLR